MTSLEQYRSYKAPGVDCPECLVDTGDSDHFVDCSIGQRLGCATRPLRASVTQGPAKPASGRKTVCCGDPTNLNGDAHPWVLVTEDGPGDVYRCPDCGATDVD